MTCRSTDPHARFLNPSTNTVLPAALVEPSTVSGPAPTGAEKRTARRIRTSLRTGKLFDTSGRFLVDCQVRDRSTGGLRLKLFTDIALQSQFRYYDETDDKYFEVELRWHSKREIGVEFLAEYK